MYSHGEGNQRKLCLLFLLAAMRKVRWKPRNLMYLFYLIPIWYDNLTKHVLDSFSFSHHALRQKAFALPECISARREWLCFAMPCHRALGFGRSRLVETGAASWR